MKKIICLTLGLILLIGLFCSCDSISEEKPFTHIHFFDKTGNAYCGAIEQGQKTSTGVKVNTTEYGAIYISEGCYTLFENMDQCPYCKNKDNQTNDGQYNNVKIEICHRSYDKTLDEIVNEWIINNSNVTIIDIIFINANTNYGYPTTPALTAIIIYQE